MLITTLFLLSAKSIVRSKDEADSKTVIAFLLCGFSLLYCLHLVIGRVSLGLRAGIDFRYATLMIPGMLALYFQASNLRHPRLRRGILLSFLVIATCKSIVLCLPVGGWSLNLFESYRVKKNAWVSAYVQTENYGRAQRLSGLEIHPAPGVSKLGKKLRYLKERRLNLYKDYHPSQHGGLHMIGNWVRFSTTGCWVWQRGVPRNSEFIRLSDFDQPSSFLLRTGFDH